nr:MAG TPA: hypothetical protein [Caudoviricetes sp.]DAX69813.1 MAG TPA: hypothetical protein [Caudoviricetes sp.]
MICECFTTHKTVSWLLPEKRYLKKLYSSSYLTATLR